MGHLDYALKYGTLIGKSWTAIALERLGGYRPTLRGTVYRIGALRNAHHSAPKAHLEASPINPFPSRRG